MAELTFNDSVKTIDVNDTSGSPYRVVTKATTIEQASPNTEESKAIFRGSIQLALQALGPSKDPYLDDKIILAIMEQESSYKTRNRNTLPARGLGQYIYGTQVQVGILDPYNYADAIPNMVDDMNTKFQKYSYAKSRDERMTCGVMSHYAGVLKPASKFLEVKDRTVNSDPVEYATRIRDRYVRMGGVRFEVTVGPTTR